MWNTMYSGMCDVCVVVGFCWKYDVITNQQQQRGRSIIISSFQTTFKQIKNNREFLHFDDVTQKLYSLNNAHIFLSCLKWIYSWGE